MTTIAILPVKRFGQAKRRLENGLDPELRRRLAEAMFEDVLDALAPVALDQIIVVTTGSRAHRIADRHGARVIEDLEQGHNAAAALGIAAAIEAGADRVLLVPGDCPALEAAQVDALLARPVAPPSALIVPDRHGTGTNALLLTPPDALEPSFGPGSCERHAANALTGGCHAEVVDVPSLALDVDTPQDLEALLLRPDVAPNTQALLTRC